MPQNKKLIINADDFGICQETNKAIKELFLAKKITSTSLLAVGDAAEDALNIAKELGIKVGAHLTLNSDFETQPWRSLSAAQSISKDGRLFSDLAILSKNAKSADVTLECKKQIEFITQAGVELDHLDNHSGTMYGINGRLFFINAFRLARQYRLPFRFPKRGGFLDGFFGGKAPAIIKAAHKTVAFVGKIMGARLVDDMISNPYSIKDIPDYNALEKYYLEAVTGIGEGVTEMFLHPSYASPKLSIMTQEWTKRQYELEFLFSGKLEKRLADEGIELVSYETFLKN
jgi:predicted glycoside hydrolase/deacetylase ChbG (UPF0249 family)